MQAFDYNNLGGLFDLDLNIVQIADFEVKMSAPDFWDDNDRAQKLISEMNAVKSVVTDFEALSSQYEDLQLTAMLIEEENDDSMIDELKEGIESFVNKLESFELTLLLSNP